MRGARASGPGGDEEIRAGAVVLATGGFQGSADLVRRLVGGRGAHALRANPHSVGDGLRMGQAAGAAPGGALDSFYGHLLPSPLRRLRPDDLPLTQYHSHACLVVNRFGRRFADEARGDEVTNQHLLRQSGARGVLLCDERVRREHAVGPPYPHGQDVDRFEAARVSGARVATVDTLDELAERVAGWGVNAVRLRQTLIDVEAAASGSPPPADDVTIPGGRHRFARHLPRGRGAAVDHLHVRWSARRHGRPGARPERRAGARPVRGGRRPGGVQETGYIGGLVLGLVFGPRAADAALGTGVRGAEAVRVADTKDPDVLIVGAGASGAVAAKRLVEEGFDVVCLEQGDWPDYSLARAAERDYELTGARDWNWDPNLRAAPADYPVDDSDSDITALMWNGVGGGTVVYAAHWQRNMPSDFRVRTLDGVADDWPLTYEDLEPYYVRVERDWGVSGLAGDTGFPPGEGRRCRRSRWLRWAAASRGHTMSWAGTGGPRRMRSPPGRTGACRPACCAPPACGGVPTGRRRASTSPTGPTRSSAARSSHGRARQAAARGRERARRRRPLHRLRRRRAGPAGRGHDPLLQRRRHAPAVPVGDGRPAQGLANSSGLVGKRLMMHPFGTVTGLFEDDLRSNQGAWGQHIHSLEFYETGPDRDFVRGAKWGLQPTGGPLAMTQAYPWGEENAIWGPSFHERSGGGSATRRCGGSSSRTCPRSRTGSSSTPSAPTTTGSRRRRSATRCRRTRGGWSSSTSSARRSRCGPPVPTT